MEDEITNTVNEGGTANKKVIRELEGAPMDVPSHAISDLGQRIEHDARVQTGLYGVPAIRLLRGPRSN